ncbi:MAG: hypothetical protein JW963_12285 [Anaerolineales bacterium]|nr:hypothetical protein [Anaerolineales bacterium]
MKIKTMLSYLWKIPLCALAFYGGTILGGMVATLTGLPTPAMPAGADQMVLGQYLLLVSLILAIALAFLARKLAGGFLARWLVLAFLVWIAHAVNNVIEGAIFTSMAAVSLFTVVLYGFASLLCGAVASWLFPPQSRGDGFIGCAKTLFARYNAVGWSWRALAALLAFPLIYLAFGCLISPLVADYYADGLFGLELPSWSQILPILLLRSLFFLFACLPVLILWQNSHRGLFLTLGLILFLLVGGLSMLQAYWLPVPLRLIHSLEILVDELVYTAVLLVLYRAPKAT